jgi:DNA-binding response OmpR family regulator
MSRLLIIEDEPAIRRGLTDAFVREGYEVAAAADGTEGDRLLREQHFDAVLLDLMLPGLSGYEVCGRMRAAGDQTPVLMLTARGEEEDRVRGLDLGADDYVTKPFSLRELSARVRALIRRAHAQPPAPENLTINGLTVDFKAYAASREGKPRRDDPPRVPGSAGAGGAPECGFVARQPAGPRSWRRRFCYQPDD